MLPQSAMAALSDLRAVGGRMSRVGLYFLLAMCLFPQSGYLGV
jgi:hypothetical protein